MKKKLFLSLILLIGTTTLFAQDKVKEDIKKGADAVEKEAVKLYNQAKTGGFKVGASIGIPFSTTRDVSSFVFTFDGTYLFEVANNLEVGGMLGYTNYSGSGGYDYFEPYYDTKKSSYKSEGVYIKHKAAGFVPIAVSGRYYFNSRKMFAGLDLGYAINVSGDDGVGGGLYARPKFGYSFGKFAAIASIQAVTGGNNYYDGLNTISLGGFHAAMVGIEYGF